MTRQADIGPPRPQGRDQLEALARRGLKRLARPYTSQRAREAALEGTVARLQAELEHIGERHTEQIERLKSFVRELVLTAESLRRGVAEADATATWARQAIEPIAAELYALPYTAGSPFEVLNSPVGEVLGYRTPPEIEQGSSDYVAFEELFRGPAERVLEDTAPLSGARTRSRAGARPGLRSRGVPRSVGR